jgi:Ca-activated chloride channel family protein
MLIALVAIPVALGLYALAQRRRMRYALRFTNLDVLGSVVSRSSVWRRRLPPLLFLLSLAALVFALARPTVSYTAEREDATLILTIDSSGSMFAEDVKPTRLEAAQKAVSAFVDGLPEKFRVGIVTFSAEAQVVTPVTSDRELVRSAVDALAYLYPQRGTAIGDAIARSVELGQGATGGGRLVDPNAVLASVRTAAEDEGSDSDPLVAILMLSDGAQTAGALGPLEGAERARAAGIPVYTVALGTPEGYIERDLGFGQVFRRPVPPDPVTLSQIAETTGGVFYDAFDAQALKAAYADLGSRVSRVPAERELTFAFSGAGAALLLVAGVLSGLWYARLP